LLLELPNPPPCFFEVWASNVIVVDVFKDKDMLWVLMGPVRELESTSILRNSAATVSYPFATCHGVYCVCRFFLCWVMGVIHDSDCNIWSLLVHS
jgi:hypothetical protein